MRIDATRRTLVTDTSSGYYKPRCELFRAFFFGSQQKVRNLLDLRGSLGFRDREMRVCGIIE